MKRRSVRRGPFARVAALLSAFLLTSIAISFVAIPAGAETKEQTIQVDLLHGFTPKTQEIATGTTVIWQNIDKTDYPVVRGAHTIVADDGSFTSPEIAPGASWSTTFLTPGDHAYHCSLHPQLLSGQLTVKGPAVVPAQTDKEVRIVEKKASDTATWGYDPKDIVGVVGLTVTWRNEGAQPHTVTVDGGFDSGNIAAGEKWVHKFTKALSVGYYCSVHPWMKGTIRIAAAGAALPPPPPAASQDHGTNHATAPPPQPTLTTKGPATFHVNIVEPNLSVPNSWGFAPTQLRARVGDTVIWKNLGATAHTATASDHSFDSGSLASGGTFSFKPTKLGTIAYICTIHPWMKADLIVVPAGALPTDVLGEQFQNGGNGIPAVVPSTAPETAPDATETEAEAHDRTRIAGLVIASLLLFAAGFCVPAVRSLRRPPLMGAYDVAPPQLTSEKPIAPAEKGEPLFIN